ncbi:MAG: 3'-5' exonuclease [Sedimenticola sp.]|uniref:DNA-directed DNA polymerase n=1 Tax=Sedimenticola thiotaurini TaxID=1543721 RepID=A0A558CSD6_9GAMM|nr:3'-5' exonuclease [Sedimenticola sp.]TVT51674.1 MAG: 3'-5' exonuclease [Sedimenticola thiotaurini]MCW8921666.1 3'-5' exonuclease [Sedimenticola sp.]MCW8946133.1 3'-5' exonuclease [Sedimenticola sp.]MCW8975070.1 3'-5' exonuclease [Sedimenticola sp.]
MASEQLGELLGRIHAGFRRTLGKGALLADPDMLLLHRRLLSVNPKKLVNKPIEKTRFVVIDTETTGLQAYAGDEICSIALLEMQGLELTGREFNTLIYPGRCIPEASTRIHHLSDDDVRDAPLIEEVMQEIADFIGESVLVGHHVGFDIRFLNKILQKELLCHLRHPWLDTMLLYLVHTGRVGHYTLEEVADYTEVVIEGRHTARGDAMITAEVFKRLAAVLVEYNNPVNKLIHRQYELGHF